MEYIRYMGHYTLLLDRFSSGAEKAVYYSGVIVRNGWSRDMLRGFIDTAFSIIKHIWIAFSRRKLYNPIIVH